MTASKIVNIEGQLKLTAFGKKLKGSIMFSKGKEFIGASILLKQQQENSSFVQIYLLLQGIEVLLKGVLLMEDFDKYSGEVLKKKFHHNIPKLISEVKGLYKISRLDSKFESAINALLSTNPWVGLRYAWAVDFFLDPMEYEVEMVYKKIIQTIKAVENRFT